MPSNAVASSSLVGLAIAALLLLSLDFAARDLLARRTPETASARQCVTIRTIEGDTEDTGVRGGHRHHHGQRAQGHDHQEGKTEKPLHFILLRSNRRLEVGWSLRPGEASVNCCAM